MACTKGILLTILIGIFQPVVVFGATPGDWTAFGGVPFGCNGNIVAIEQAASGQIYLGGAFSICGDVEANNIVRYDPSSNTFTPLISGGVNGVDGPVGEIEINGQELYAAGFFTSAGDVTANYVARWDGTSWNRLGTELANGTDQPIRALEIHDGVVFVGGFFSQAGAISANNVARWDGSNWLTLPQGTQNGTDSGVLAIQAASSGLIYIGGTFQAVGTVEARGVAQWDGQSLAPLGNDPNNAIGSGVFSLTTVNGDLIAGGGGFVASWDGQSLDFLTGFAGRAEDVAELDGNIAATAGSTNLEESRVNVWDGSEWIALGGAFDGPPFALMQTGSDLWVGGIFKQIGGKVANGLARWDGVQWQQAGPSGSKGISGDVNDVAFDANGNIFAAGDFDVAGKVLASNIARWDGIQWAPVGDGLTSRFTNTEVQDIETTEDGVYVVGRFENAGSLEVNNIAQWDGAQWRALDDGAAPGVNGPANAIAVSGPNIYVAGSFTMAGGVPVDGLARWDGSGWQAIEGVAGSQVRVLALDGTDLYAGGNLTEAGGNTVNSIARWDGTQWHALGDIDDDGPTATVFAIAFSESDVFVGGGSFQADGQFVQGVAIFDGAEWHSVDFGSSSVRDLGYSNGFLYAAGTFVQSGGQPANRVARWDGELWSALGDGDVNGVGEDGVQSSGKSANALDLNGDTVAVGGEFLSAGGDFSANFATFTVFPEPSLVFSATVLDFSEIEIGESSPVTTLSIQNDGEGDLLVSSMSIGGTDPGDFDLLSEDCVGQTVIPGNNCAIEILFSPSTLGPRSASLDIESNASSSPDSVALNGIGMALNQPFLTLSRESVNFGDVGIGDQRIRSTALLNEGGDDLVINAIDFTENGSAAYIIDNENCTGAPVPPGAGCGFNVSFTPTQVGLQEAVIEIQSNALSTPDTQPYTANAVEAPVLRFAERLSDLFDFGSVTIGTTADSGDIRIRNVGSASLEVQQVRIQSGADDFLLAVDSCTGQVLGIQDECSLQIEFSPSAAGIQRPSLIFEGASGFDPRLFLGGEGVDGDPELDLMPDSIDFGNVAGDGVSDAASVSFSNPGVGPLEVTAVDPAEAPFIQAGGTCGAVPFSVPAGDSCTIDYQFQPTDPGDFAQTFAVESDAIAGSDTEFSLTGTSGQFDVAVMKSNAAEFVLSGVPTIYDIQVLNLGLSDLFGVEIVDILPPQLDATGATWTCTPGTGATCPIDSGTGDIDELVDIPAGAGMAFTLVAPVIAEEGVDVVNTVTVTMPAGIEDEDPSNNEATDSDPVAIFAGDFEFAGCSDDLIENRFCVTGENVLLDIVTGLEWQRCPFGRVWDETNQICTGEASGVEWDDAVVLAPDGGWRLPSVEELSTLRYCSDGDPALFLPSVSGPGIRCNNVGDIIQPVIEPEAFPNWPLNAPVGPPWFWTTTDGPDSEDSDGNTIDGKIAVSFGEGSILNVNKISPIQVLLVRD